MGINSNQLESNMLKFNKYKKINKTITIISSVLILLGSIFLLELKDVIIVFFTWILFLISCKWLEHQVKNLVLLEFIRTHKQKNKSLYSTFEMSKMLKEIEYILGKSHKKMVNHICDIQEKIYTLTIRGEESDEIANQVIINTSKNLIEPINKIDEDLRKIKENTQDEESLSNILSTVDNLNHTINELFELSKVTIKEDELNIDNIDLNVIINQVCIDYKDEMDNRRLNIIKDIPNNKNIIQADGEKLWSVVDELFNNICKFTEQDTRVYLSVEDKNENLKIEINNISKKELNTTYLQLSKESIKEGKLGLVMVKKIIDLHNGDLAVDIDGDLFIITIILNKGGITNVE